MLILRGLARRARWTHRGEVVTASEISYVLAHKVWKPRTHVIVPNLSWGLLPWEADLAVLHGSGYMDEVEIKISLADLRREFETKAEKHERLVRGSPQYVLGVDRKFVPNWSDTKPHIVRRFWFAMPERLIEKGFGGIKLPDHAGLIAVSGTTTERLFYWKAEVIKQPKVLTNSRKLTDAERMTMMRLAYLRYWGDKEREQWKRAKTHFLEGAQ